MARCLNSRAPRALLAVAQKGMFLLLARRVSSLAMRIAREINLEGNAVGHENEEIAQLHDGGGSEMR